MNEEKWVAVPGFDDYQASSLGRIRSLDGVRKNQAGGVRKWRGKILKLSVNSTDRLTVTLYRDGKPSRRAVHRIICSAFNGPPPPDKPWALHRNGDHRDNRPENLYWGDAQDNVDDMFRHGTHSSLKPTCHQGHERTPENLYIRPDGGGSQCIECARLRAKRARNNPPPAGSDLHGRPATYSRTGCRCDLCVEGMKEYLRKFKGVELPVGDSRHGLTGAFNYACKCDVCLAAARAHYKRQREKRRRKKALEND